MTCDKAVEVQVGSLIHEEVVVAIFITAAANVDDIIVIWIMNDAASLHFQVLIMALCIAHELQKQGSVTIDFIRIDAGNREKLGFVYFV